MRLEIDRHPCFNVEVKGECGRVHLPVAPACNIKCNYCNRKTDCVNESRPGVTSAVLTPEQALSYLGRVMEKEPSITVVGIAGPGDPMANAEQTIETLRLVRSRFPSMLFCLASNGLGLPAHVDELADLGVTHVTVTINAVDPAVGRKITSWVRDGKVIYRGARAAEVLLDRQMEAVRALKARGIMVKVNTIVIPGINDDHVVEVARAMADLGVDILNCMPVYPNADTPFENVPEPTHDQMTAIRSAAGELLPQMHHCTRCRADAVGLLEDDRTAEFRDTMVNCSMERCFPSERPYVAVATLEGMLVNQHLGEAHRLQIWEKNGDGFRMVEEREAPEPGGGVRRWMDLAERLKDCRAVLVSGIGDNPRAVLARAGIVPVEMSGFIQEGLEAVHGDMNVAVFRKRRTKCGSGCSGGGTGCG
ncbi:MAG: nitrogenase cofactor biosynthesis protein NifB [Syntrophobacteraceae bacterium]|jgi:nitrogen fixation protein NifB|nr:nitrogenase cofactor biosynthesis protein NifB [Syntrophobacteraceae bacterium]